MQSLSSGRHTHTHTSKPPSAKTQCLQRSTVNNALAVLPWSTSNSVLKRPQSSTKKTLKNTYMPTNPTRFPLLRLKDLSGSPRATAPTGHPCHRGRFVPRAAGVSEVLGLDRSVCVSCTDPVSSWGDQVSLHMEFTSPRGVCDQQTSYSNFHV